MRIEVEPDALIAAGQQTGSLGAQLGRLSDALGAALAGGIASGLDPAGLNFGMKYGHQAAEFAGAVADAANAFSAVGKLLEATGCNYRNADAASRIGGPGPAGQTSDQSAKTLAAHVPPGPNAATVPPPGKWYLVQPLLQLLPGLGLIAGVAMTWPSGNAAMMSVTALQWRNFATGFALVEPQLAGVKATVAAQSIPEGADIATALESLGQAISSLADVSSTMAQSISDFATGVQSTQDAIRRLLDRLSLDGLWDTLTGFLTGEGDDILREVARDVGTVLNNFQQQVKGIVGLLDELTTLIGDAATTFQKWIRPILVAHLGDTAGNALANTVTWHTDVGVGAVTALIGTVSGVVAMADPDTWKGMADMALSVAQDPTSLPGVLTNMGKEFLAWDKWSGEHPGRAAGEAAFNIGSLFVPGGALSKTGTVAKGLNLSRRVLEEGRLPRVGELGGWTRATPNAPQTPHIPEHTPTTPGSLPPVRPAGPPPGAGPGTPATGPATHPDPPSSSGPGRPGEPPASGGRPSTPSAEGGAGPRAPVDQAGRTPSADASSGSPTSPNGSPPTAAPGGGSDSSGGPAPHQQFAPAAGHTAEPSGGRRASETTPPPQAHGAGPSQLPDSSHRESAVGPEANEAQERERPPVQPSNSFESERAGPENQSGHRLPSPGGVSGDQTPHHSSHQHHAGDSDQDRDVAHSHDPDSHASHVANEAGEIRHASDVFPDASPYGDLTEDQFNAQFIDDEGQLLYPDDSDPAKPYAVAGTIRVLSPDELQTALHGSILDRLGHPGGGWLSPEGTPYEDRALPPSSLEKDYYRYRINASVPLPDGWAIEESRVAPWFGQPGGGIQYRILAPQGVRASVEKLVAIHFLEWL